MKQTNIHIALFALAFGFLFSSCAGSAPKGSDAPSIKGELVNGSSFDLAALKGNYVLVDFWASWCGPCLREAPSIVALNEKYAAKKFTDAKGFELVSIAVEKKDGMWQKVVEKFGFNWTNQLVEISSFVRTSSYASAYGVTDIPSKFLIGPDGNVLLEKASMAEIESFLESKIK
jgi:thiol-disulfide isomerase/thioredoxin